MKILILPKNNSKTIWKLHQSPFEELPHFVDTITMELEQNHK